MWIWNEHREHREFFTRMRNSIKFWTKFSNWDEVNDFTWESDISTTNDSHLLLFTPSSMSCFYTQFISFIFFHVLKLSRLLSFRVCFRELKHDSIRSVSFIISISVFFLFFVRLRWGWKILAVTNDFPHDDTTSARLTHQPFIIIGFIFDFYFTLQIFAIIRTKTFRRVFTRKYEFSSWSYSRKSLWRLQSIEIFIS